MDVPEAAGTVPMKALLSYTGALKALFKDAPEVAEHQSVHTHTHTHTHTHEYIHIHTNIHIHIHINICIERVRA